MATITRQVSRRRRATRGDTVTLVPAKTFRAMQVVSPDPAPKLRAMVEASKTRSAV